MANVPTGRTAPERTNGGKISRFDVTRAKHTVRANEFNGEVQCTKEKPAARD
ncbi:hypothetical protein WN48_01162 [Eufriesea mexicana]|nr:hypothetical protein WN48_01162 [Eufriesea mexicana]